MFGKSSLQAVIIRKILDDISDSARIAESRRVASANHLARKVAYELDEFFTIGEDQEIEVFDDDGEIRSYQIKFIYSAHLGLVSYILKGIEPDNARIHLVFRGTKDAPAWCRNMEDGGPGHVSFYANRDTILEELCLTLSKFPENHKCQLYISGQSLGGADAQNAAAAVIIAMAQQQRNNEEYTGYRALNRISKITINHTNSAGITNLKAIECKQHAEYLVRELGLTLRLMVILTAGDIVPYTGQNHILYDCTPGIVQVEVVKLNTQYEVWASKRTLALAVVALPFSYIVTAGLLIAGTHAAYRAHKTKFFDNEQFRNQTYQIYTNKTEEGRQAIKHELHAHPLDNPAATKIQNIINRMQIYLFNTQRQLFKDQEEYVMVTAEDSETNAYINSPKEIELQNLKLNV